MPETTSLLLIAMVHVAVAEVGLVLLQEGQNRLDVCSDRVAAVHRLRVSRERKSRRGSATCSKSESRNQHVLDHITFPATKGTSLMVSL